MSRPLVVIESPYSGDIERNIAYLQRCILHCISRGEAPFASHQMYTTALDDETEVDRMIGLECGYSWLRKAKVQIFYLDHGWSSGMIEAWRIGWALKKPFDFRWIDKRATQDDISAEFMKNFERWRKV